MYKHYFFSKLRSVQGQAEERGLLPHKLDVEEAFGILHSFRNGSVMAAGNAPNSKCNETDINRE